MTASSTREGPIRIHVLNWQDRRNPRAGGAEIHLHEIFGRLAAAGHPVTLLASGWEGAASRETVDGIDVHRVGGRHSYAIQARGYYERHLAPLAPDVVIEDLNKIPLWTPRWVGAPLVLLVHHLFGTTAFQTASLPLAAATWALERPIPWVYRGVPTEVVSESTVQDLVARGLDRRDMTIIHNGVDGAYFSPSPGSPRENAPMFVSLVRLEPYKRVDLAVRAFAMLAGELGDRAGRLVVAGRGRALDALRALARELGVAERVEFAGYVPEEAKRELLRRAWAHVYVSPKEGWGIANMEAAACGTPSIASDSPGLRDSVRSGETGLLVPHGDVAALAGAMRSLATDRPRVERLGAGARAFALTLSWERSARETEDHLRQVVAAR